MGKRRYLPKYVSSYLDRHGKQRFRYRRKGQSTYSFQHLPGSEQFLAEYRACLDSVAPVIGANRSKPGSIDDLVTRFYCSPAWQGNMRPSSQATYRGIIERFRKAHGDKPVSQIKTHHLDAILGKMADRPAAANNLRKVLKRLFRYAVKIGMRTDNPAELTDGFKSDGEGFHTWTEGEIAAFEARHPIGTRARLAFALLLHTGQRRSDVVKMGRQHIKSGRIMVRQTKTGAAISIPINMELQAALNAMPGDNLTLLLTEFGKPFTSNGFGNWFRDRCDEAGLPQCSAHGLRKAMSRRLAESGATNQQGRAITGHKTDREFNRYAAMADQERLSNDAMANLDKAVSQKPEKSQ